MKYKKLFLLHVIGSLSNVTSEKIAKEIFISVATIGFIIGGPGIIKSLCGNNNSINSDNKEYENSQNNNPKTNQKSIPPEYANQNEKNKLNKGINNFYNVVNKTAINFDDKNNQLTDMEIINKLNSQSVTKGEIEIIKRFNTKNNNIFNNEGLTIKFTDLYGNQLKELLLILLKYEITNVKINLAGIIDMYEPVGNGSIFIDPIIYIISTIKNNMGLIKKVIKKMTIIVYQNGNTKPMVDFLRLLIKNKIEVELIFMENNVTNNNLESKKEEINKKFNLQSSEYSLMIADNQYKVNNNTNNTNNTNTNTNTNNKKLNILKE
jgi:hypothetical protein